MARSSAYGYLDAILILAHYSCRYPLPVGYRERDAIPFSPIRLLETNAGRQPKLTDHHRSSGRTITTLSGLPDYHQTLLGTDGRRLSTSAAELAWVVHGSGSRLMGVPNLRP